MIELRLTGGAISLSVANFILGRYSYTLLSSLLSGFFLVFGVCLIAHAFAEREKMRG